MKKLQTTITKEIAKLQFSPTFQIQFIELSVKESRGTYSIILSIGYENRNSGAELIRELKVDYTGPSFAQAKIKAERLMKEAVSEKAIKLNLRG